MTLFGPEGEPPRMATPPAAPRFYRYTPRTRQLCSDCTTEIHERGVAAAPYPAAVRWRALIGSATYLLCERHKDERQEAK